MVFRKAIFRLFNYQLDNTLCLVKYSSHSAEMYTINRILLLLADQTKLAREVLSPVSQTTETWPSTVFLYDSSELCSVCLTSLYKAGSILK